MIRATVILKVVKNSVALVLRPTTLVKILLGSHLGYIISAKDLGDPSQPLRELRMTYGAGFVILRCLLQT